MDVLTWVVVEQHQADVSVPNSSGLNYNSCSLYYNKGTIQIILPLNRFIKQRIANESEARRWVAGQWQRLKEKK